MPRPPLPLGSYGKITSWEAGSVWIARAKFRDFDGVVRLVKRSGKTKAAAVRALRASFVDRQAPVKQTEVTAETKLTKVAELWLAEVERAVACRGGASSRRREQEPRHGARAAKIVISGTMRYAARHGAVTVNLVREVARTESEPRRPPRSLTADERERWLSAVDANERARLWDLPDLSLMMLATGCRIGECLAIGWTEVDLDDAAVDVCWRLVRQTGVGLLRLSSTKSGRRGERLVPLPSWAMTMLKRRRLAIGPSVEAVFPDSLGGWRDPSNVRRVGREVRDELEMTGLVSHTLRKTVASFLDDAAVPVRKISDQLGHSKISMTQDS